MPQTAFSIARKSFNMKRESVLPVPLLYSYERLFFCSRILLTHELFPLHQRLGLYTNPNKKKKKRFFNSLFQCNTFLSKFSLTRPQAAIAKDPGTDGEANLPIYINNTYSETKNCQRTIFLGFVHTFTATQD